MAYLADLHNHSCLSPCGSLDLSPKRLVEEAAQKNISLLALTDHNSWRNLETFGICCKKWNITPIFGMEITSVEEAHILALFGDLATAISYGEIIEDSLPDVLHDPSRFGDQVYVNEYDEILGALDKTLFTASSFSIDEIVEDAQSIGGLVIPAHIDRPAMSISSQLGFLPDLPYAAVESISHEPNIDIRGNALITGSDAHMPRGVGLRPFLINHTTPSFESLQAALKKREFSLKT